MNCVRHITKINLTVSGLYSIYVTEGAGGYWQSMSFSLMTKSHGDTNLTHIQIITVYFAKPRDSIQWWPVERDRMSRFLGI